MIQFKGLEIGGNNNETLYCVGHKSEATQEYCEGIKRLQKVVEISRGGIETFGHKTMLPPDKPQSLGKEDDFDDNDDNDAKD